MNRLALKGGKPVRENKIALTIPFMGDEEADAAATTIRSTWISSNGKVGRALEHDIASYLGVKHAILVNNCTSALHLALMALGIKGGEVIIPDYTFTSTGLAPILVGAKPVLCDVEVDTANIDTDQILQHINPRTKAINPVHYAGHPCDMDKIFSIAEEQNLTVVEDAAQAIGSEYKGRKIGSLNDTSFSCFSFHAIKNISCGEGGLITTNDEKLAYKATIMRDKGTNKKDFHQMGGVGFYEYLMEGHNFMLSEILAAVAKVQFSKLNEINALRTKHAVFFNKQLKPYEEKIKLPIVKNYAVTNWHIYAIRVPEGKATFFSEAMNAEGIQANTHYPPLHLHSVYKKYGCTNGDFPNSEHVFDTLVRIPLYPQLGKDELHDIVAAIDKVYNYL